MPTPQFIQERDTWVASLPLWQRRLAHDIIEIGHCREGALESSLREFMQTHGLVEHLDAATERIQNLPTTAPRPAIRTDRPL